jgi:hypothetical protein
LIKDEARWRNFLTALTATYSQNQVLVFLVQSSKIKGKIFFSSNISKNKPLIFKEIFSAFQRGNLTKPAWQLGFLPVKPLFSTKLSTAFVDS